MGDPLFVAKKEKQNNKRKRGPARSLYTTPTTTRTPTRNTTMTTAIQRTHAESWCFFFWKTDDKLASVEKITLESQVSSVTQVLKDAVFRQQALGNQTGVDITKSLEKPDSSKVVALKADFDKLQSDVKSEVEPCMADINKIVLDWQKGLEGNEENAVEIIRIQGEVTKGAKDWTSTSEKFKSLKNAVQSLLNFKKTSGAAVDKILKTEAQSQMNKNKVRSDNAHFDTGLAKEIKKIIDAGELDNHFATKFFGVGWAVLADFIEGETTKCVVIPKEVLGTLATMIRGMDYYREQKAWAQDLMKSNKMSQTVTAIVRPAVLIKIKRALMQHFKKDLVAHDHLGTYAATKGTMDPQFYQQGKGANKVSTSSDFGLSEVRMVLEGSERIWGLPLERIPGQTFAEKQASLGSMRCSDFFLQAKGFGFYAELEPDTVLIIPSKFALVSISATAEVTHGLRMLRPTLFVRFGIPQDSAYTSVCDAWISRLIHNPSDNTTAY